MKLRTMEIDPSRLTLLKVISDPVHNPNPNNPGMNGILHLCQLDNQKVVVKYFAHRVEQHPNEESSDEEDVEFWEELFFLAENSHPNICPALGITTNTTYNERGIVMPFMANGNLKQYYTKMDGTSWDIGKMLKVALDIARGLAWLDGKKSSIIHLDMKPENVLVDADGTCKICDFGLSTFRAGGEDIISSDGGNLLYAAPEYLQPRLRLPRTTKADVFSYGVLLWEILTGRSPYEGIKTKTALLNFVITNDKRPSLQHPVFQRYPYLATVLRQCWERHPESRPTTGEVVKMLEKFQLTLWVTDETSRNFWEYHFGHVDVVTVTSICAHLTIPPNLLKILFFPDSTELVENLTFHVDNWNKLSQWFLSTGVDEVEFVENIRSKILDTCKKQWFFGMLAADTAGVLVANGSHPGCFLVRLNDGSKVPISSSPFTITILNNNNKPEHWRVLRTTESNLTTHQEEAESICELVEKLVTKGLLALTAAGSPFSTANYMMATK